MSGTSPEGGGIETGGFTKWIDVEPALDMLNRGPVLRRVLGFLVQVAAVLLGVLSFIDWCRMWRLLRHASFLEGVGFFLILLGLLAGGFFALQAMFVRGRHIREMPESDYVVIPIVGALAALAGEMAFLFLACMSVPVMAAAWCEAQQLPLPLLLEGGDGNDFLAGLYLFLSCWLTGLAALVAGRWIKESVLLLVQIARDVKALREKG